MLLILILYIIYNYYFNVDSSHLINIKKTVKIYVFILNLNTRPFAVVAGKKFSSKARGKEISVYLQYVCVSMCSVQYKIDGKRDLLVQKKCAVNGTHCLGLCAGYPGIFHHPSEGSHPEQS